MRARPVVERVDALLKPLGFRRHKATWNRRSDVLVDVVDVQISKDGEALTVNAGVLHANVHRICWATDVPAVVRESDCVVRARVGKLIDRTDVWWSVGDQEAVNDVAQKITVYVLPFLEQMHSLAAMERYMSAADVMKKNYPLDMIQFAILKSERGDKTGACAVLAEMHEKPIGAWRTRLEDVSRRLECSRA